jgi:Domain of unknown function (DUF4386)
MTTAMRITTTKRAPMDSMRKTALVAGVFYLITFISIPTLALYGPVKDHRDWILGSGGHTAVLVGGLLEVIVALAGIGTAVTLYPVVKRQSELPCCSPPSSQRCSAASGSTPPWLR